jgi:hypothetical protein
MAEGAQDWEMSLIWCDIGHAVVRVCAVDLREFPSARRMDGEWSFKYRVKMQRLDFP